MAVHLYINAFLPARYHARRIYTDKLQETLQLVRFLSLSFSHAPSLFVAAAAKKRLYSFLLTGARG